MSYFSDNYRHLSYPIGTDTTKGLRNAQIGAIHSIASHFTVHDKEPAIVVMPTGSGKTGVLFLSCFVLRANRVLVITPSRLVRNQIAEGFQSLKVLIDAGALPADIAKLKVKEVTGVLDSNESWDELSNYDVVVSAPNSLPVNNWHIEPNADLFDLVLIDEAHHSPAQTWNSLLKHFSRAKKVLFTATPFRRDKKEIKGRFIYDYPISKAYEDKIFGEVDFIAVPEYAGRSNDITLAIEANRVYTQDKARGFEHRILVRTNTKKNAKELKKIYLENTGLKLKQVDSSFSAKQIELILLELRKGELDGVICVDMLGEGFDFPNLKIGVIHNPHKSLAITLQFIGRFARTNAEKIDSAKFLAIPNEINFLKLELYQEGAVWRDIIKEISEGTIQNEIDVRNTLQEFVSQPVEFEDDRDISLYSLKPFHHVKIYDLRSDIDIFKQVQIPGNSIDKHFVSADLSVAVYITKEVQKPKWLDTDELINVNFNLFVIYFDSDNHLLYINSTKKTLDIYTNIAEQYIGDTPKQLPLALVHKVIADLANPEVFNLGLRSKNTINDAESYVIKAGAHVQNSLKTNDFNLYEGGHMFLRGENDGGFETIGYSSASKVWSNTTAIITDFVKWCNTLSVKINSANEVKTNTDIDRLSIRKVVDSIPANPIFATWSAYCYKNDIRFHYSKPDTVYEGSLVDLEIQIDYEASDTTTIYFSVGNENFSEAYKFDLDNFFSDGNDTYRWLFIITSDGDLMPLSVFLHEIPIRFFFQDFASLRLNEITDKTLFRNTFSESKVVSIDWSDTDIEKEYSGNANGKLNIHQKIQSLVIMSNPDILIYDHGSGEMADFISIKEQTESITIELYHCKGSGAEKPGNRVGDLYEVCGQVIKSSMWTNSAVIKKKVNQRLRRANPSTFIIGNQNELTRLFGLNKMFQFKVFAVQPGLLKSNIGPAISEILAASESFVENGDGSKFSIITS